MKRYHLSILHILLTLHKNLKKDELNSYVNHVNLNPHRNIDLLFPMIFCGHLHIKGHHIVIIFFFKKKGHQSNNMITGDDKKYCSVGIFIYLGVLMNYFLTTIKHRP